MFARSDSTLRYYTTCHDGLNSSRCELCDKSYDGLLPVEKHFELFHPDRICRAEEEPICFSRYDYDRKMMKDMLIMEEKIQKLELALYKHSSVIQEHQRTIEKGSSYVSYTRWGRNDCPETSQLVYRDNILKTVCNTSGYSCRDRCNRFYYDIWAYHHSYTNIVMLIKIRFIFCIYVYQYDIDIGSIINNKKSLIRDNMFATNKQKTIIIIISYNAYRLLALQAT
ncbi:hypothetical protein MAR_037521 [Mya arenaria]|uniref:C2H2-type domain-containing protein n=1 Tax=Mya arenaria TaxID=6604 RepID=A0ABY7FQI0_MYAAR|nr:hypothetical protein MAR_037521 [Mya arenaria]